MSQTFEAVIDQHGAVRLLKPVHLTHTRRALVTILDDPPATGERELEAGYSAMAEDEDRETDALDLSEATIGALSDEAR